MRREQHLEAGPRAREREMEREREGGRGERREREGEGARARARARVRGCVSTASVRAARGEEGVEESEIARAWRRRAGAPCGVILTTSEACVDPQGGRVAWGGRGTVLRHPPRSVPCRSLLHGHTFFGYSKALEGQGPVAHCSRACSRRCCPRGRAAPGIVQCQRDA